MFGNLFETIKGISKMAADVNCPSQFAGQPWSAWTEHLGHVSPVKQEEIRAKKRQADSMRLPREEMGLFGHCPERDPFYTVVCEYCNILVKPQGLRNHMDLWHKMGAIDSARVLEQDKTLKCSLGPKTLPGSKPTPGSIKLKVKKVQSSGCANIPMERLLSSGQAHVCASSVLPTDGVVTLTKGADKILLQSENAIGLGRSQSVSTGPVSLQVVVALTPLPSANELATIMTILPRRAFQAITETLNTTTTPAAATTSHNHILKVLPGDQLHHSRRVSGSPQKKRQKSNKLPIRERAYDPDKHCGVWNEESNKHCTRSLTCKTHLISLRRAVKGRSKHFNKLLADHRAAKEVAGKLGKALGIVQVTGLGPLPSPVSGASFVVPVADLSASCLGPFTTPMSFSPEGPINGLQNSSSDPHSLSYPATDPPLAIRPVVSIDAFESVASEPCPPSKATVLTSLSNSATCHFPRRLEELAALEFVPRSWVRSFPKPATVCSVSSRKLGGVEANHRRVELFYHGLKTALVQGCLRVNHTLLRPTKEKVLSVRHKPITAKRVVWHS